MPKTPLTPPQMEEIRELLLSSAREFIKEQPKTAVLPSTIVVAINGGEKAEVLPLTGVPMEKRHACIRKAIELFNPVALWFLYDGYVTGFKAGGESCPACLGAGCDECLGQGLQPERARQDALILMEFFPGQAPEVSYQHYVRAGNAVLFEAVTLPVGGATGEHDYPTLPALEEVAS